MDSGGFTYVRLTTALNPPAQVLTNKDKKRFEKIYLHFKYWSTLYQHIQIKYDTFTFLLDLSYSET